MIAFAFAFPVGRYHATPWGRHANEADAAWPPEPVRIVRALIATWWRKADHERFSKSVLNDLIDTLASELPVFCLPEAVHAHIRAYMPAPSEKKLIYDAFLRLGREAEIIVAWPNTNLAPEQRELSTHLLERIGYLGRAESWASGHIADNWNGETNASPRSADHVQSDGSVPVDIAVPLTAEEWAAQRMLLLASAKRAPKAKQAALEVTLPERLADALAKDTSDWQKAGWSSPPPLRRVVYDRPPVGPLPKSRRPRTRILATEPGTPEVARFVLAGRPQPRIEEALRIGELARLALMSGSGSPPQGFSGRGDNGPQRDDPAHAHAFFLPEDADADGLIDHLIVYCRRGFSAEARRRLDRLTRLWLAHGRADDQGERGRKEWRVALEGIAAPQAFSEASTLLRASRTWKSVTPYLMPWHAKRNFGVVEQIRREVERRGNFPKLVEVGILEQSSLSKQATRFDRIRSRRHLVQPDTLGCFAVLTFEEAVIGPLALGFASHYGLGLFTAIRRESTSTATGFFQQMPP